MELWQGYFHTTRPSMGRLLVQLDTSARPVYRPGPLIDVCLRFLNKNHISALSPTQGLSDQERQRLRRFVRGLRITTRSGSLTGKAGRAISGLTSVGACEVPFMPQDGRATTLARFLQETANIDLRHPSIVCIEVCYI